MLWPVPIGDTTFQGRMSWDLGNWKCYDVFTHRRTSDSKVIAWSAADL